MTQLVKELPCKCEVSSSDPVTQVKLYMVTRIFLMPELLCVWRRGRRLVGHLAGPMQLQTTRDPGTNKMADQEGHLRLSPALLIHTVGCTYPELTHIHT